MAIDKEAVRRALAREQFFDEHRGVLLAITTLLGLLLSPAVMALGWEHLVVGQNQSYELGRFGMTVVMFLFVCSLAILVLELIRRNSASATGAEPDPRPGADWMALVSLTVALCALILLVDWVRTNPVLLGPTLAFTVGGIIFFTATGAIFRLTRGFFHADILQRTGASRPPRRAMVMFLSPQCKQKALEKEISIAGGLPFVEDLAEMMVRVSESSRDGSNQSSSDQARQLKTLLNGELPQECSDGGSSGESSRLVAATFENLSKAKHVPFFKWQQNIRAIRSQTMQIADGRSVFSRDEPFLLVTIPSPESHREYRAFDAMLRKIWVNSGFSKDELKTVELAPVDYDHLPALTGALREAVHLLTKGGIARLSLSDITIDTTPGFKTASIAAAAVTFESDLEFSYVTTIEPWNVIVVDMKARFRPNG